MAVKQTEIIPHFIRWKPARLKEEIYHAMIQYSPVLSSLKKNTKKTKKTNPNQTQIVLNHFIFVCYWSNAGTGRVLAPLQN